MDQIQANLGLVRKADNQSTNVLRRDPLTGIVQVIKKAEPSTKPFNGTWGDRLIANLKKAEQSTAHTCAQKSEPKAKPAEPQSVGANIDTLVKKASENVEILALTMKIQKLEADVRERDKTIETLQAKQSNIAKNETFNNLLRSGSARAVRFASGMGGLI